MPVKKSTTHSSGSGDKPKRKPRKQSAKKRATVSSAKKSTPKKSTRNTTKPPAQPTTSSTTRTPEVEQGIAQAVERIPQLLQDEARMAHHDTTRMQVPITQEPVPKPTRIRVNPPSRQRYQLLWLGVGLVSLVVFGMWIWNAMSLIYDIQNTPQENKAPWNAAGEELRDMIESLEDKQVVPQETATTSPQIDLNDQEAVENAIRALLQKQRAASSTTPAITTTTTSSTTQTEI